MGSFAEKIRAGKLNWLFVVIFYAVIANIPFWVASDGFSLLSYGWFCVDYAVVGLLALFLPRVLAAFLLLLVIAVDIVWSICVTFSLSITEWPTGIGVYYALSTHRQHFAVAVILLILLVTAIAAFMPAATVRKGYRLRVAACLIVFVVLCLSADCITLFYGTGHIPNPLRQESRLDKFGLSRYSKLRLARIPIIRLLSAYIGANAKNANQAAPHFIPSATAQAVHLAELTANTDSQEKPNLVLVLVESWGLAANLSVRDALASSPIPNLGCRPGMR